MDVCGRIGIVLVINCVHMWNLRETDALMRLGYGQTVLVGKMSKTSQLDCLHFPMTIQLVKRIVSVIKTLQGRVAYAILSGRIF